MAKLYNLARVSTATTGTGTITLGAAVSGYLTFALAGVANGDVVTYGIKDGANSEVGWGVYTSAGTTLTRGPVKSTNSNSAISLSGSAEVFITAMSSDFPFPDNYLSGLTIANDGINPATIFDITAGAAADATNVEIMRLTTGWAKSNAAWAVGSGFGGIDAGSIAASTWYHIYLIRRPDTGVVDVLFSTNASAPTMPTNYTQKRRIGSIKTDGSSNFLAFVQDGDRFMWKAPVLDITATNPGTSAVTRTLASIPTGFRFLALLTVGFGAATPASDNPAGVYVSDLSLTDTAPTVVGPVTILDYSVSSNFFAPAEVVTNTSAQVRSRIQVSGAGTTLYLISNGWVDTRGRNG